MPIQTPKKKRVAAWDPDRASHLLLANIHAMAPKTTPRTSGRRYLSFAGSLKRFRAPLLSRRKHAPQIPMFPGLPLATRIPQKVPTTNIANRPRIKFPRSYSPLSITNPHLPQRHFSSQTPPRKRAELNTPNSHPRRQARTFLAPLPRRAIRRVSFFSMPPQVQNPPTPLPGRGNRTPSR